MRRIENPNRVHNVQEMILKNAHTWIIVPPLSNVKTFNIFQFKSEIASIRLYQMI